MDSRLYTAILIVWILVLIIPFGFGIVLFCRMVMDGDSEIILMLPVLAFGFSAVMYPLHLFYSKV